MNAREKLASKKRENYFRIFTVLAAFNNLLVLGKFVGNLKDVAMVTVIFKHYDCFRPLSWNF